MRRKREPEQPEHNTCSHCCFFDVSTKDGSDFVMPGEDKELKRACRRFPVTVYKAGDEWCGEWVKA